MEFPPHATEQGHFFRGGGTPADLLKAWGVKYLNTVKDFGVPAPSFYRLRTFFPRGELQRTDRKEINYFFEGGELQRLLRYLFPNKS